MIAPDITYLVAMTVSALSVAFALTLFALDLVPLALNRWFDATGKRQMKRELASVRFARMLEMRRVPLREFVSRLEPARLQRAAQNCRECHNASHCEAVLRGYLPAGDYGFCPNREAITRTLQMRLV